MVNSNKLTVTRLSSLQKLILKKLREREGEALLVTLAYDVAESYDMRKTERVKRSEREFEERAQKRGLSFLLLDSRLKNRIKGSKGDYILDGKFKATFYRSVTRLVHRGLLRKRRIRYFDEYLKRYRTLIMVELSPVSLSLHM